jgi:hypothetical protein
MNRTAAVCSLLAWVAIWLCVATTEPQWLGDSNRFMKSFLEQSFIEFMGVVVTITLASSANLFIELNKLEDRVKTRAFPKTKRHVKHSAFALIGALVVSVALSVIKPIVDCGERSQAIVNGFAVLVVLFSVLILIDLTVAAFHFEPPFDGESDPPDETE